MKDTGYRTAATSPLDVGTLFSLAGKTAVVTGGSRGIGHMIASGLVANGVHTVITARKADDCNTAAAEINDSVTGHDGAGVCISIPADVSTGDGEPYTEPDQNTPGEIISGVSITPSGLHNVNRERPEGWWEGDLGQIYRPKYFVGGVAVHGSNSIPNYPASHGCVRVSVPAMDWIWESGIMPMKTPVWVHDGA